MLPSARATEPPTTRCRTCSALSLRWVVLRGPIGTAAVLEPIDAQKGVMMLHGPIPDPGTERRRRVMRSFFVLVAVAVLGYVLGATAWLDLLPWSR